MSATARKLNQTPGELPVGEGQEYATPGAHARRASRPHLRLVSPLRPERASRGVFAVLVTSLLGIGLVAMLLINTQLAQGAFVVSELSHQKAQLAEQEAVLNEQVAAAAAPEALSSRARALGMIPSETPVFIRVPDGAILGKPKAAKVARDAAAPRIAMPADVTAAEAVDNAAVGSELPVAPPADYDPAAADAGLDAVPVDGASNGASKAAASSTSSVWTEIPVDTGDAGLDAVPVE